MPLRCFGYLRCVTFRSKSLMVDILVVVTMAAREATINVLVIVLGFFFNENNLNSRGLP